ncbi:HEPN domain-containing protein [Flavitalea flava]
MNTSLGHLPVLKRDQIDRITKVIINCIHPEKVILFGLFGTSGAGGNVIATSQFPSWTGSYDLLVIMRRGDRRPDQELQELITNRCRSVTPVTVLVHDIEYINDQLSEGNYFFSSILQEAVLLYDAGSCPFVKATPPDLFLIKTKARRDFERWWFQGKAFFRSALFNRQQKQMNIAVFLLHQAAEHAYQAILLVFTGYKPCTHNLDKLRRYTCRFSIELAMLFPGNSKAEESLFRLLLYSYIDARYKEGYSIGEDDLDQLTERIDHLLSLAERLCRNRFVLLDKMLAEK